MELKAKIDANFKEAFKAKKEVEVSTLKMLRAAIGNAEIEDKGKGGDGILNDEEILQVIMREIKKRKDSVEMYTTGRRPELAENENKEIAVLSVYLPAQMSEEEVRELIKKTIAESGAKDLGSAMKVITPLTKGKADGGLVSKIVKEMNKKVAEYGMASTSFIEPSGVEPANASTVRDLFTLSQRIFKENRKIFDITRLRKINDWRNSNFFSGNKRFLGGKTGYIPEIQETFVSLFSLPLGSNEENRNIIINLIGTPDREKDTIAMIKWLQDEVAYREIINPRQPYTQDIAAQMIKETEDIIIKIAGNFVADNDSFTNNSQDIDGETTRPALSLVFIDKPITSAARASNEIMHPLVASVIAQNGFDTALLANANIWPKQYLNDSIARLNDEKIQSVLPNQLRIFNRQNIKIGILSIEDTNQDITTKIQNATQQTDILIVALLQENGKTTSTEMRQTAETAIDNGTRIVIGNFDGDSSPLNYQEGVIALNIKQFAGDNSDVLKITLSGTGRIKTTE